MDDAKLDRRLVAAWREAGEDLRIAVTAPAELRDARGAPFWCEAFVPDFGSPAGAVVVSAKTERRVREPLHGLGLWHCVHPTRMRAGYLRKHFIAALVDWGWFGPPDERPDWWPVSCD